jgi:hypothetical protein
MGCIRSSQHDRAAPRWETVSPISNVPRAGWVPDLLKNLKKLDTGTARKGIGER